MKRNGFDVIWLLLATLLVWPSTATARQQTDEKLVTRIQAVSRQAKSAGTATQLAGLIEECDSILAAGPQDPSHIRYLQKLLGWALDKRGVQRMELAAEFGRAGNLEQAGKIRQQALADFDRAFREDDQRWQTPWHRGLLLTELERYTDAVNDFSSAIRLNPESAKARFNRAELQYQLGNLAEALDDYDRVLKTDPADLAAVSGRAHCLLGLGRFAEALRAYDRVVQQLPNDGWARVNRADALLALQRWPEARDDLQRAVELHGDGEFCRRLAWLLATCPDDSICDGQRALQLAELAIGKSGETEVTLDTLAAACAAAGHFDRARDIYARVIAMQDAEDPTAAIKQAAYESDERYQAAFDR
jgi:tetratricopeptide (TPR) repeat protein